jgi:hypothetical protein
MLIKDLKPHIIKDETEIGISHIIVSRRSKQQLKRLIK